MLSQIGLVIMVTAWIMQGMAITKKKKSLTKNFVLVFGIGVAFLIVDGFKNDFLMLAILYVVVLAAAAWVYSKVK